MEGLAILEYRHDATGLKYNLGLNTLCIQVRDKTLLGYPLDNYQAAENIADAFEDARRNEEWMLDILDEYNMNPPEFIIQQAFKQMLISQLYFEFGGNPTLNTMGCLGVGVTIPVSNLANLEDWQCQ